jgi:hypothetical protein
MIQKVEKRIIAISTSVLCFARRFNGFLCMPNLAINLKYNSPGKPSCAGHIYSIVSLHGRFQRLHDLFFHFANIFLKRDLNVIEKG